jgi:hypothetical protein
MHLLSQRQIALWQRGFCPRDASSAIRHWPERRDIFPLALVAIGGVVGFPL